MSALADTTEAATLIEQMLPLLKQPISNLVEDDERRRQLRDLARNLSFALEVPGDTVHRIDNSLLHISLARVGTELNIFQNLVEEEKGMSVAQLTQKTGADPALIARILRYYASMRMVLQVEADRFVASNVTRNLAPPAFLALPEYLKTTNFRNPSDPENGAWHLGHQTTQGPFDYVMARPAELSLFMNWMLHQRVGLPIWLDAFPFDTICGQNTTPDTILFVDVGGAGGHQSAMIRQRYLNLQGRIIVQDQAGELANVNLKHLAIETMVHDFYAPQPVKGARAYYLRNILHDWPTATCQRILSALKPALSKESVVLIDEMVLPEVDVPWRAAQLDWNMAVTSVGMERTWREWRGLFEGVGLEVVRRVEYTEENKDCIIVLRDPEAV